MNAKEIRRKKRQDKRFNNQLVRRTIKKLFGDIATITTWHWPTRSVESNHRRVVTQRVLSKRLDLDNYRKVKH